MVLSTFVKLPFAVFRMRSVSPALLILPFHQNLDSIPPMILAQATNRALRRSVAIRRASLFDPQVVNMAIYSMGKFEKVTVTFGA